jgi:hypothetical protein
MPSISAARAGSRLSSSAPSNASNRSTSDPLSVLQIFRSVVDDPVPRCARPAPSPSPPPRPGEADIIIGRPEPESANNNPLKEMATAPPATSPSCGQQPLHRPGGPSRSVCVTAR